MALFGGKDPIRVNVRDAKDAAVDEVRPAILALLAAAALLFVIAIGLNAIMGRYAVSDRARSA